MSSSIVVIGPADALPSFRDRLDSGAEVHTFTDAETLEALDHIIRSKPRIVALDHEFSATSRGTALINRIKDDPSLANCEVRVIAHDSALNRVAKRRGPARQARGGGGRAASRRSISAARDARRACAIARGHRDDGRRQHASLVDLSIVGAQVLSPKMLKPNQRVRLTFTDGAPFAATA